MFIYASSRLKALFEKGQYSGSDAYSEFDIYIENRVVNVDKWYNDIKKMHSVYIIELANALVAKNLGDDFEYFFKKGTKYFQLSAVGLEHYNSRFEKEKEFLTVAD